MILDLLVLVKEPIGKWKDGVYQTLDDITEWVGTLANQSIGESGIKKERCEVCGSSDKRELHHIAGEKHDYRTVTLCLDCHHVLSDKQKLWDKRWEAKDQSTNVRQAFFLQGLKDLLELKASRTGNSNYATLAAGYIETISKLLRG